MGTIEGRHQPQIYTTVPVPNRHRIPNPAKLNNFRSKFKRFGQLCRSSAVTKNFAPVPPPYTNIYGPICWPQFFDHLLENDLQLHSTKKLKKKANTWFKIYV